jgi:carboxypeptidase Taq
MEKHCSEFEELRPYLEKKRRTAHEVAILYYDLATLCPEKGLADEGELLNRVEADYTAVLQDPQFKDIVIRGTMDKQASPYEKRLFSSLYKDIELMEKLTLEEYLSYRNAISHSNEMWRKSRPNNDFAGWLPAWKDCVKWARFVADKEHKPTMKTRYDSCLDAYEPGESETYLDQIFIPLKEKLIALLKVAKEKQKDCIIPALKPYDTAKQRALGLKTLEIIHYDMKGGCLMESAHPFSNDNHRHDARLTTKYLVEDWRSNVFTCLHEGGHCLEFQNKPEEEYENYVESVATSAIDETHSRFYENLIGRSVEFAPYIQQACAETLDPAFALMKLSDFYRLLNKVEPGLIRCEADELSYCLHIIIRYEIERDLINEKIECEEVPALWKKKYHDYLGVEVPNDKDGCMQDTHWSEALFGYFPSYALGNIYGAMIKERMEKEIHLSKKIKEGDFGAILAWFADKDFRYDWMEPGDWIKQVAGKPLTSEPYIRYLEAKFGE